MAREEKGTQFSQECHLYGVSDSAPEDTPGNAAVSAGQACRAQDPAWKPLLEWQSEVPHSQVHRSDDTKEEGELPSASTDAAGAVAQELDQAAGDTEASALHGAAPSASKDAAGVAAHEPDQAAGDTESEGLHGAAPSASKNAVEVAAQEPDLSANPDVPMAQQAAAQRCGLQALCVLATVAISCQ